MGENGPAKGVPAWAMQAEFQPRLMPLGELTVPRAPLVHVWYLDLGGLWQTLSSVLGAECGHTGGAGVDMTAAQLRFARRFYLRTLLGAYLGLAGKDVALIRGPRGKPVLDKARQGDDLHFSLSKSGDRVLIGISGSNEVGVDLELTHRKPRNARELARRFFSDSEARSICELRPTERDAAFMRIWACKEAVAKASGQGIAKRFYRFSIDAGPGGPPSVSEDREQSAEGWQLALLLPEPDYLAAVAVRQPALEVEAFRI